MARGAEGKLRRRNRKQEERANVDSMFGDSAEADNENAHDFGPGDLPTPPGMSGNGSANVVEDDSEEEEEQEVKVIKKKKKSKKSSSNNDDDMTKMPTMPKKSGSKGIKTTPLILLIIMTGTTLLPALIFASDYLGNFFQKHHVLGQVGFRLGMGAVPRQRVLSFYEKHDPAKVEDVPNILSKYYGDYPTLIKKLERKYQDYGYFLGWEEDEAPLKLALEQMHETYHVWVTEYWNRYAPQPLKTAARNIRYNLTTLYKKFKKVWKKSIWPVLEPVFGVPKGSAAQKRKDTAEARRNKPSSSSGTRRRNTEFRDDVEED